MLLCIFMKWTTLSNWWVFTQSDKYTCIHTLPIRILEIGRDIHACYCTWEFDKFIDLNMLIAVIFPGTSVYK